MFTIPGIRVHDALEWMFTFGWNLRSRCPGIRRSQVSCTIPCLSSIAVHYFARSSWDCESPSSTSGSEASGSEASGSEASGSEASGSEASGSEASGSEASGSEASGSEASEASGPEAPGSEASGPAASGSAASGSAASGSAASDSEASGSATSGSEASGSEASGSAAVLALFTVGDVHASLCKRGVYAPFNAQRRSRALLAVIKCTVMS